MICYCLGVNTPAGIGALIFYSVASVIRLAYFNVSETKRQNETSENRQYYQGLPITSMAIILPFLYLMRRYCGLYFLIVIHIAVIIVGLLFYSGYKGKKTSESGTYPAGCSRGTCTCEDVPFDIK